MTAEQLQCQRAVGRTATTADQAVIYQRHKGCRDALGFLTAPQPDPWAANDALARSVERQARMAGARTVLPVVAPSTARAYVVIVRGRRLA